MAIETDGSGWRQLCAEAAVEQDPERLLELAKEITRLLDKQEVQPKSRLGTAS